MTHAVIRRHERQLCLSREESHPEGKRGWVYKRSKNRLREEGWFCGKQGESGVFKW